MEDSRDVIALILAGACILIFGIFGYFLPDWIGISPRKKSDKDDESNANQSE